MPISVGRSLERSPFAPLALLGSQAVVFPEKILAKPLQKPRFEILKSKSFALWKPCEEAWLFCFGGRPFAFETFH